MVEALNGPEDIDLSERKRLNEGLRRRMQNPKGLVLETIAYKLNVKDFALLRIGQD